MAMRCMCGRFLPDRQSGFWQPRWRGCIPRRTTRCATRGRRCGSRWFMSAIATVLGYLAAIVLPPMMGIEPVWGTVGLTTAASIAGWVELLLLRRSLNRRIGQTGLPRRPRRTLVERRLRCSRSCMGHQTETARGTPDSASGADSAAIRCRVSGIDGGAGGELRRAACSRACEGTQTGELGE